MEIKEKINGYKTLFLVEVKHVKVCKYDESKDTAILIFLYNICDHINVYKNHNVVLEVECHLRSQEVKV